MAFVEALQTLPLDPARRAELEHRAGSRWPAALAAFRALYAGHPDLPGWERRLAGRLAAAALDRADDLCALDRAREAAPDWFQQPGMVGYSFYVDRFAGTLRGLADRIPYLKELGVRWLHPLPLLKPRPGDSDGGFAVADFRAVDPALGSMDDLRDLAAALRAEGISLCLDVVCNHTAAEHPWAEAAKAGHPAYRDYYHILPDRAVVEAWERDLDQVFPVTAPGNFTVEPALGGWVWTTFYPFQWDLNYANPAVFVEMPDVLLFLANQGAEAFRLDSIPFLWKRPGTDCRGLPETHTVVRAWRAALAIVAPAVALKAEAIVGLEQVLPFFGTGGEPECHIAYNNAAMAGLWAALSLGDAGPLARILDQAAGRPAGAQWLTYLRCHDDIIWDALAGELPAAARRQVSAHYAGAAATAAGPVPFPAHGRAFQPLAEGVASTNGMTASLLGLPPGASASADQADVLARHALLHGILLALDGIPTLYMGDELALRNDEGYAADPARAAEGRWLHRPVMDADALSRRDDPATVAGAAFAAVTRLIALRAGEPALHGAHPARPFDTGHKGVLGFVRGQPGGRMLACIANLTGGPLTGIRLPRGWTGPLPDRIGGAMVAGDDTALAPWQVLWLVREG
ncbi:MAG: hypothetical protein RLY86_182 [Pseudomonadota bacterium]|jgi:amylosucrase